MYWKSRIRGLKCVAGLGLTFWVGDSALGSPVVSSVQPLAGTVTALTEIEVTFSEPVTNVIATDLLANGNPAATVIGGNGGTLPSQVYTFVLERQPEYGSVSITWDPSHDIRNLSNQRFDENGPSATWQYTLIDATAPAVVGTTPAEDVSVRTLTQIEVLFSEPVTGVDASDLLVNTTPASSLAVLGPGRYRFSFSQPSTGIVSIAWAANHGIFDLAASPNPFGGGTWTYTLDPNLGLPSIRINEFLAANVTGLMDENGEPQDWIEIWNYGDSTVNLAGYSLTDDPDDPARWTFPATNIGAGGFLVVFASGKDRKIVTSVTNRLHTNFKLGADGDYLGLLNAESPPVAVSEFRPDYPEQRNNHSYGYDSTNGLKYFAAPTPGAPNGDSAISTILPAPHFNVERGYFESPFTLILSIPVYGAAIRYTTDGSEPTLSNGATYSSPITISNTAVIRASAFKTDVLPSVTVTHTYLFLDKVLRQPNNPPGHPIGPTVWGGYPADYEMDPEIVTNAVYGPQLKAALQSLPSVSIVSSIDNLFGPTNGIYTHVAESSTQFRGVQWERACSVEFLPTNGAAGFQINCGVRMQGNASRNPQKTPKHPFRLLFKGDYGPGRLEYPLYPDSPVQSFNTLVLRADFNNSWLHWDPNQRRRGTRIRDGWVKDTWRDMGQPGSHTRYFHLYVNGLYWGVYDFGERIDAEFCASYLGGEPEEYDAMVSKPTEALDGDRIAYDAMVAAIRNRDQRFLSNYVAVLQHLDVPNFIDYMLLNFYGANQDWGNDSNWNAVRKRSPDGRFKYISWDGEQLIVATNDNRVSNTDVPGGLHTALMNSPEYRLAFGDRAHKHLFNGGALTTNAVIQRWLNRVAQVDPAIIAESARWGDYRRDVHQYQNPPYILYTRDIGPTNWLAEVTRLTTEYFPQRGEIFLQQLRAGGLYPSNAAPSFSQHGGPVLRGFNLTMSAADPIYFTTDGSDPRVFGTGLISPTAIEYTGPVVVSNSVVIKARALSGTNWSAIVEATFVVDALASALRFTEIMYNPMGGDAYEFLELQNVSSAALNVGAFSIDGIGNFVFAPNTILGPGQVIVLGSAASPGNWSNRYPGITVLGRFTGRLDNGGEKLTIRNGAGQVLFSVDYDDENGWPVAADGAGYSLEIIDVHGDPDDPANWRASSATNGTPGVIGSPPSGGAVVLNEIMAENISAVEHDGFYPDWVELHNPGMVPVTLDNWSVSDDSNPRKFVFPTNTTVAAGDYLIIWCDTNSAISGLRAPFGLGRNGDAVFLFDGNTNRVDAIGFGIQIANYTVGRIPNGTGPWTLNSPTPNTPNTAVVLGAGTNLVINEWLANAVPGGDDWIELYNPAAAPVPLRGLYVGTSDTTYHLNALSFVAAGGFVQLLADENEGANHLDFNLPAEGDAIVLYDERGVEMDRVVYGPQSEGVSQGRLPDGSPSIASFPATPSPAASNYLLNYAGPILSEVLAINRTYRITNTASALYGRSPDFVELWNTNASVFDVSGMRLSTDPADRAQWVFPSGTTIAGNSYLVVWFDEEAPPSTTGGAVLNTGRSLDGESGEVWLFNAAGQPVDSVVFGFQIADLPIGRQSPWALLTAATPGAENAAPVALGSPGGLRINEWFANSSEGDDWFEIYNTANQPVDLSGLFVADSPAVTALRQFAFPPFSFIGPGGFVRCFADGHPSNGRDHVNFELNADGESLRLVDSAGSIIDTIYFGLQQPGVSQGPLTDGMASGTPVDFPDSPTPAESNYLPLPTVINEVLSRPGSADPDENAIEIYNPSDVPVDLGGWYLSDSQQNFKKYRIAPGTIVMPDAYAVFYESNFNGGPNSLVPFSLDAGRGGEAWLSAVDGTDTLTGYRAGSKFGAAQTGVSFGRHIISTRQPHFVAQATLTLEGSNALPRVGPVVINEIMYHPPDIGGTTDNVADEYIELYNLTTNSIPLYEVSTINSQLVTNSWRLRGGAKFAFPPGVALASRSLLLVVSFNPAANPIALAQFRGKYGLSTSIPVYGPYLGKLDNGGETIELVKPSLINNQASAIVVDRVAYDDVFPWSVEADGSGSSLQRRRPHAYGDDPINWKGAGPTPGRQNVPGATFSDADHDGISDGWESTNGLSSGNPADADADADGDGSTNYEEFIDGTNPQVASSRLSAPAITGQPASQTKIQGSNAVFNVTASGSTPLSYQWYFNGNPIAGGNGASLILNSVDVPNAGEYDAVVWNGLGFAVSQKATLTVHRPPRILAHPQNFLVASNGTANFSVTAEGTGTLRYQWQFRWGGTGAGPWMNLPDATNRTLAVTSARLDHEGDYRVLVTDDIITVPSAPARLTVRIRAAILVSPIGSTNVVGSSITFSVTASGSVPMGYQWRRSGSSFTNWIVLNTTNSSVTLHNLRTNDSFTNYQVIITNSGGVPAFSAFAPLLVVAPPVITAQPASRSVVSGTNVTFSAGVGGSAAIHQWHFAAGSSTQYSPLPNATNSSLILTNVQFANEGSYYLVSSNFAGTATSESATLTVTVRPLLRDLMFGVPDGFRFGFEGNPNRTYAIEITTNLLDWVTLTNVLYTNGVMPFTDSTAAEATNRFYRVRLLP